MDITLRLAFQEGAAVRLLNWLAQENALLLAAQPELPSLYAAGVTYERERREVWSDALYTLNQGAEDCDALAAYRAGELLARGAAVLGPTDGGFYDAWRLGLTSIPAEVMLTTDAPDGDRGSLYHCIVRYFVDGKWYRDDPSARLGMVGGRPGPNPWGNRQTDVGRPPPTLLAPDGAGAAARPAA